MKPQAVHHARTVWRGMAALYRCSTAIMMFLRGLLPMTSVWSEQVCFLGRALQVLGLQEMTQTSLLMLEMQPTPNHGHTFAQLLCRPATIRLSIARQTGLCRQAPWPVTACDAQVQGVESDGTNLFCCQAFMPLSESTIFESLGASSPPSTSALAEHCSCAQALLHPCCDGLLNADGASEERSGSFQSDSSDDSATSDKRPAHGKRRRTTGMPFMHMLMPIFDAALLACVPLIFPKSNWAVMT